jgi:hypothetical protein
VKVGRTAWAARPLDETLAWGCLAANLIGVPGVGTAMAGRRTEGLGQVILAVGGGIPLTWFLLAYVAAVLRTQALPPDDGPDVRALVLGLGLFLAGWLWSLVSSVSIVREARRSSSSRRDEPFAR